MAKKITKWEPDDFELEMTTHWSFPKRGDWATHDAKWRGNWSPYIPRNIILRYSQEGDLILDQFSGGGTTLVEAKLLNRNIIGVDVNPLALERCVEKCDFESLSSQDFFSEIGKKNAKITLNKWKNDDKIVVDYKILIKKLVD